MIKRYTVGFIFSPDLKKVLLIEKARPEWQKGMLNGVGGKFEYGEEGIDCIVREVEEETGLSTIKAQWIRAGDIGAADWNVEIFTCIYTGNEADALAKTDEVPAWYPTSPLPDRIIPNLSWIIPLCLDKLEHAEFESFHVSY